MQVTRLAVTWDDALSFIVDEDLSLRRLKFADTLQEKLDDVQSDDAAARFDAAFTLMTLELERLFPALFDAFGGEDRSALVDG
ncbi:MAG: recombination-associated protein RdgC [Gammaproteobacteria bacterium]|nr:recombination-associated protein RdgC [Gammaproteobacteria bacterium]